MVGSPRTGSHDHPYSALNLRLLLAAFGLVAAVLLAVLAFMADQPVLGVLCTVLAVLAAIDLVVVQVRRRQRRRREPGVDHSSLFE